MAEKQKKQKRKPRITSPRGLLRFPSLLKPDYGTKEYPKPAGVYKTGLILVKDDPKVVEFLAALQAQHDEAIAAATKELAEQKVETRKKLEKKNPATGGLDIQPLYTVQYDTETEEETGNIVMNFTKKASGKRKDESTWRAQPPFLFDAMGQPITSKSIQIWGGTEAKVSFETNPYFIPGTGLAGLSFRLVGVQIIKLVSGGTASAEDLGFAPEEGGFEFDADDFTEEKASTDSDDADGDADASEEDDF